MKNDVYGIGNALVDLEFKVTDQFLAENDIDKGLMTLVDEARQAELISKLPVFEAKKQCGGSAANTVIGVAQYGGKSFYSCKVAKDELGEFYLNDLRNNHVEAKFPYSELSEGTTGKCMVMVTDDGERTMNTFLGITETLSTHEIDENELKNSKWLYIEGYLVTSPTGFAAAMETQKIARENNVKVSLTLSDLNMVTYFKDNFLKLMNEPVDLLFSNEQEALGFIGTEDLAAAIDGLKKYAHNFVITRGAQGALFWDGNKIIEVPAKEVKPLDTNGAGDLFAGSFLYGLTNELPHEKCLELGINACSKLITKYGARLEALEVQDTLKTVLG